MQPLTYIPSLGFELQSCHDVRVSEEIAADEDSILKKDAFLNWRGRNLSKIVGYFPVIGTIMAIYIFTRVLSISSESLTNKVNWIARNSIQFLSLGALLFIPDLIATLYRKYHMTNISTQSLFVESKER